LGSLKKYILEAANRFIHVFVVVYRKARPSLPILSPWPLPINLPLDLRSKSPHPQPHQGRIGHHIPDHQPGMPSLESRPPHNRKAEPIEPGGSTHLATCLSPVESRSRTTVAEILVVASGAEVFWDRLQNTTPTPTVAEGEMPLSLTCHVVVIHFRLSVSQFLEPSRTRFCAILLKMRNGNAAPGFEIGEVAATWMGARAISALVIQLTGWLCGCSGDRCGAVDVRVNIAPIRGVAVHR
jgi:hypothetical protein